MNQVLPSISITLMFVVSCSESPENIPRETASGVVPDRHAVDVPQGKASSLEMMEAVFVGGYSQAEIKEKLDRTLLLYGLPITEDSCSRYGSVLVRMRKETPGVTEMEILDHMIRSHTPGIQVDFPSMAALSAVALSSGDR